MNNMTEFQIAERALDPEIMDDHMIGCTCVLCEEWDDEIMQAIRREEKAEREKEVANNVNEALRDIGMPIS